MADVVLALVVVCNKSTGAVWAGTGGRCSRVFRCCCGGGGRDGTAEDGDSRAGEGASDDGAERTGRDGERTVPDDTSPRILGGRQAVYAITNIACVQG